MATPPAQMHLENNPDKYLYKWRYVELGRYWDASGKSGVTRVQDRDKNPILVGPDEIEDFRNRHNNFGLYTSAWLWPSRAIDNSACWASLYLDLDHSDLEVAHADAKRIVSYLREFIPRDGLKVYFSGKKGFHILGEALCLGITPSLQLPELLRFAITQLSERLNLQSVDFAVIERRRLFRLVNSQHQVTKLFKVELDDTLLHQPIEDILAYAIEPHDLDETPSGFSVEANEWWRQITYEWENQQETLADKISRFERFGTGPRTSVTATTMEFSPRGIFECECNLIGKLWEKAENESDLTHNERLALCSLLTYDDESIEYLYAILANCADYDTGKSNAHIQDWIHRREKGIGGHPVSCRWLQQNGMDCGNCDKLERREKLLNINGELMPTGEVSEPSPVRFLYRRV